MDPFKTQYIKQLASRGTRKTRKGLTELIYTETNGKYDLLIFKTATIILTVLLVSVLLTGNSQAAEYEVMCSSYAPPFPNKNDLPCNGLIRKDDVFIYVWPETGIKEVDFYLDGKHHRKERHAPYEVNGSGRFNRLGRHQLEAHIVKTDNTVIQLPALFFTIELKTSGKTAITVEWFISTDAVDGYKLLYSVGAGITDASNYKMLVALPKSVNRYQILEPWCDLKLKASEPQRVGIVIVSYSNNWLDPGDNFIDKGYQESYMAEPAIVEIDPVYDRTLGGQCAPSVVLAETQ